MFNFVFCLFNLNCGDVTRNITDIQRGEDLSAKSLEYLIKKYKSPTKEEKKVVSGLRGMMPMEELQCRLAQAYDQGVYEQGNDSFVNDPRTLTKINKYRKICKKLHPQECGSTYACDYKKPKAAKGAGAFLAVTINKLWNQDIAISDLEKALDNYTPLMKHTEDEISEKLRNKYAEIQQAARMDRQYGTPVYEALSEEQKTDFKVQLAKLYEQLVASAPSPDAFSSWRIGDKMMTWKKNQDRQDFFVNQFSLTYSDLNMNLIGQPLPSIVAPTDQTEEYKEQMNNLFKKPENNYCSECGCDLRKEKSIWGSVDNGVTVCITCAGAHRQAGTHITQTRSLTIDNLSEEERLTFEFGGNKRIRDEIGLNKPLHDKNGDLLTVLDVNGQPIPPMLTNKFKTSGLRRPWLEAFYGSREVTMYRAALAMRVHLHLKTDEMKPEDVRERTSFKYGEKDQHNNNIRLSRSFSGVNRNFVSALQALPEDEIVHQIGKVYEDAEQNAGLYKAAFAIAVRLQPASDDQELSDDEINKILREYPEGKETLKDYANKVIADNNRAKKEAKKKASSDTDFNTSFEPIKTLQDIKSDISNIITAKLDRIGL